jgi:hypothetical protein
MFVATTPAFAAEGPLLTKITKLLGCESLVRADLPPERAAVLADVKNLAVRITLLSRIVNPKQFNSLVGSTPEELDASLAQLAGHLFETKPNALKTDDIKESLDHLESRLMDNLTASQKEAVTVADVPVAAQIEAVAIEPQTLPVPNEYQSRPGLRTFGPSSVKP